MHFLGQENDTLFWPSILYYRQSSSSCHQSSDEQHNMLSTYRHLSLLSLNMHLINLPQSHISATTQSQQASSNLKHLQIISGTKIRWAQESGLLIKIIQVFHTALSWIPVCSGFFSQGNTFPSSRFHVSNLTFHTQYAFSMQVKCSSHSRS